MSVCPSVCVSGTFVNSVKTNKHIFKILSPSGSYAILVFPYQTARQYSNGNPPNGGVKCKWGRQESRLSGFTACCQRCDRLCVINTRRRTTVPQVVHLALVVSGGFVDSGKRRRNVYDKKSQRYIKHNTTAYNFIRSDKSVAYVTNNERLRSTFCTIEANY